MNSLEEVRQELDKFTDKQCERCNKTLKHNKEITEVIYCHRCNGLYCLDCWLIQRSIEEEEGEDNNNGIQQKTNTE